MALSATAANYQFIKVADTNERFGRFGAHSISSNGTVAFYATPIGEGPGIYTGNGGPITTIVDSSGPFLDFLGFPTVNAGKTVAFHATLDAGGAGIFSGSGGSVTTIADISGPFSGFTVGGTSSSPAINDQGAVAYRAALDTGGEGIFIGSGGPTTTIAHSSGPFQNFGSILDLNAAGTAAFEASFDAGGKGIFTGSGSATNTIADSSGPLFNLLGPAINDNGEVAFWAEFDDHFRPNIHQGIITGSGGPTTTAAASGGTFFWLPGNNPVSINRHGKVLFKVELQNARPAPEGLFTGPDSIADKVIASGDPLFGSTVQGFGFTYRSLSDNGDIAFAYGLQNGESGIAVARLIPEPASLVLLIAGIATAALVSRRLFESPFGHPLLIALTCPLIANLASRAAAANYDFINIADTSGPASIIGSPPMMNNHGVAVFHVFLDAGGQAIYAGSGGPLATIADTAGEFQFLGNRPAINDSGTVAFNAEFDNGGAGVFLGSGGSTTTIADRSGPLNGFSYMAINNSGTVAFNATGDNALSQSGIFTGTGGPITTIANNSGPFSSFGGGGFGEPDINENGTVFFSANIDPNAGGGHGIFSGNGGPVTTIADNSGVFSGIGHDPAVNEAGTVAVNAGLDTGQLGISTVNAAVITTIVDTSGQFAGFNFIPGLNDDGMVAFSAVLDAGGEGIFIGPDPMADKVIQFGDALFGSTLTALGFDRGLNNNGDIAFRYMLANGVSGIAVARLVPESTSIILPMIGLFAVRRPKRPSLGRVGKLTNEPPDCRPGVAP